MELIAAVVLAGSLLAAAILLIGRLASRLRSRDLRRGANRSRDLPRDANRSHDLPRACPLCSSVLGPGERIASKLFPGKGDRIMHIMGCAHCWPAKPSNPRICPVCGGALEAEGWVVARYFERPGLPGRGPGRRHVHMLGCANCRRN